jgi:hypothetical protein
MKHIMAVEIEINSDNHEWWSITNTQVIEALQKQIEVLKQTPNKQNDKIITWTNTVS